MPSTTTSCDSSRSRSVDEDSGRRHGYSRSLVSLYSKMDKLIAEAVLRGAKSPIGVTVSARSNHSETVLPLIQSVLEQRALPVCRSRCHRRIHRSGFVYRICVSVWLWSKGLPTNGNLPVVGVSSLEAQAARVADLAGTICPLLDARKQEVYAALFDRRDGKLVRCLADQAIAVIGASLACLAQLPNSGCDRFCRRRCGTLSRADCWHLFDERAQIIGENLRRQCRGSAWRVWRWRACRGVGGRFGAVGAALFGSLAGPRKYS